MTVLLTKVASYNEYIARCRLAFKALGIMEFNKSYTDHDDGICGTLNICNTSTYDWDTNDRICDVFGFWEKFSGWLDFPVPCPNEEPDRAYWEALNYWGDDEYGQNRHELNQFCVDYLTEALK